MPLLLKYADANMHLLAPRGPSLSNAATAYVQALSYDPGNREVKEKLAGIYEKTGAWMPLEYQSKLWLESEPADPSWRYYHALALDRLGRGDEALDEFRRMMADGSTDTRVYGHLAQALRDAGDVEQANEVLDEAYRRFPQDALVRLYRAQNLARSGDAAGAGLELDQARALDPDNRDVVLASMRLALFSRDLARAVAEGRQARLQFPNDAEIALALAEVHAADDDASAAIAVLRDIPPEVAVDYPDLLVRLADLQIDAEQTGEADETIAFYAAAYPDQQPILEYFEGRKLLQRGEAEAALERLAPIVKLRPRFRPARYALAVAHLETGRRDLARSNLEAYLRENPTDLQARTLLARHFGQVRDLEEIAAKASQVLDNAQSSSDMLLSAGLSLFEAAFRQGDVSDHIDEVAGLLEQVMDRDPGRVDAYRGLADAYVAAGEPEQAQAVVARATLDGVGAQALAKTRAGIALAQDKTDQALAIYEEDLLRADAGVDDAVGWASFFAARGRADVALALLEKAPERFNPDAARLAVERAALLAAQGRPEQALALLAQAEASPGVDTKRAAVNRINEIKASLALAFLRADGDDGVAQARGLLDELDQAGFQNADAKAARGMLYLGADPPGLDQARALFEQVLAAQPEHGSALSGLAHIAVLQDRLPEALVYAERAAAFVADAIPAQLRLADIHIRLGHYTEARRLLSELTRGETAVPEALELLTEIYLQTGALPDAESTFAQLESAYASRPEKAQVLARLRTRLLVGRGSHADAERLLRKQLAEHPDDFASVRQLAGTLVSQDRWPEAKELLRDYADRRKQDPGSWVALAEFFLESPSPEALREASTALTRALLLDRTCLPALRLMIEVQMRQGGATEALGLCEEYLRHEPDDPDVLYCKARLMAGSEQNAAAALDTIQRALSFEQKPEYIATRGLIRLSSGDFEGALRDLQAASQALPRTSAPDRCGPCGSLLGGG